MGGRHRALRSRRVLLVWPVCVGTLAMGALVMRSTAAPRAAAASAPALAAATTPTPTLVVDQKQLQAALLAPSTSTPPSTPGPPPAPPTTFPPFQPTRVMVIGDSGTWDMYPAFQAGFRAAGIDVMSAAFPGEGLTNPEGIRHLWYDAADRTHRDFFIVSIGTWDDAFIAAHGWAAYEAEIDDTVRTLTRNGAHMLWLSMMPSDDPQPDAHTKPLLQNRLFESLPERYPGVVDYLDIGPALTAPDGTTPREMNGQLLRKLDGWHLCPDGAAAIAHLVLQHLGLDTDRWEQGSWRRDPRYDDPHGACPNTAH